VLFATESECGSFQSTLSDIVRFRFPLASVQHNPKYAKVQKTEDHEAILGEHYKSEDNADSPECYSVDSRMTVPGFEGVPVHADMQPMLWENASLPCFAAGNKGIICHLMSQTAFTQYAAEPSNILIISADNHFRFDGYSVDTSGIPKIAIRFVESTLQTATVSGTERTVVRIAIECIAVDVYHAVKASVKEGTDYQEDRLTFFTTVAVPNADLFRQFLTFKYWETLGLWDSVDPSKPRITETSEKRLKRVREEVAVKMALEPDLYSIDTAEQRKPKKQKV